MEMRTVLAAMLLFPVLLSAGPAVAQQPAPLSAEPLGASSCSGCHGRSGGMPAITAKSADEIAATMLEYRAGQGSPTVMNRIRDIAAWIVQQR
jgi:sulfide dehydrogenase cytochrome subunit